jgi:cell division protein FtsN/type VI protein secretion system component VasF
MKNEQWEAVHDIFDRMEELCSRLQILTRPLESEPPAPGTENGAREEEVGPGEIDHQELVRVRAEIRTQLDFLRMKLAEQLTERDCYLVLFPIVAFFDEYVQTTYLGENQLDWPPLQRELFQIDDAGEIFYDTVDDILRKPQTIPFIYEVYYFCLNKGFLGRHIGDPVKINEYLKRLREKIPVVDLADFQAVPEDTGRIRPIGSSIWYYAASVLAVIAIYFLLRAAANHYWDQGFTPQTTHRPNFAQLEGSDHTASPAVPARKEARPKTPGKGKTVKVKVAVRQPTPEPGGTEAKQPSAGRKRQSEPPPQSPVKTKVARAAAKEKLPQPLPKPAYIYSIHVGSFKEKKRALARLQELQRHRFDAWIEWVDLGERGYWYRVLLGKYTVRSEAAARLSQLKENKAFQDAGQMAVQDIYAVQVGAYQDRKLALDRSQELQRQGFDAWIEWVDLDERGYWYRVLVGKYKDRSEAAARLSELKGKEEFQDACQVEVLVGVTSSAPVEVLD